MGRYDRAFYLIERLSLFGGIIPLQVLGEFLNVCRNKKVLNIELAASRIETYATVFETPTTVIADLTSANRLLSKFSLQYFDALILTVARRAGATMLLSEDMHDGLEVDGIRVVNPFAAKNDGFIRAFLASSSSIY